MSFRFLKIANYYRDFLHHYYMAHPQIKTMSYRMQFDHLMDQCFAWSDNYGRILEEKGCETMEIVANASALQKAWNKEYGSIKTEDLNTILFQQIQWFKPEVIYVQDSVIFNGTWIKELRQRFPFVKLVVGNLCSPFSSLQIESFKAFDFFTVCSPFFQKQLSKYGIPCEYIPHAFDNRILNKIEGPATYRHSSVIFIGSIIADEGFHSLRKELLETLINEKIEISFFGNLPDRSSIKLAKRQASYLAAKTLTNIGLRSIAESITSIRKGLTHQSLPKRLKISDSLYKIAQPPIFGIEMYKALAASDIGFNIHIDCAGDYAANMRMFETTGVGTCLITDWKSNIKDFFTDGEEIVTYKTKDECFEKIKFLIDNPEKCKAIALKGQEKTLKHHHFQDRVTRFYEAVEKRL